MNSVPKPQRAAGAVEFEPTLTIKGIAPRNSGQKQFALSARDAAPEPELATATDRFVPPHEAQSISMLAEWMPDTSLDIISDEAITVILKDGTFFLNNLLNVAVASFC